MGVCTSTHTKYATRKHGTLTGSFPVAEILYKMQQSEEYLVPMKTVMTKKKNDRQKLNIHLCGDLLSSKLTLCSCISTSKIVFVYSIYIHI